MQWTQGINQLQVISQWRGALKTRAMAEFDSQPRRPTPKLKIAGLKAACAQRGLKGGRGLTKGNFTETLTSNE